MCSCVVGPAPGVDREVGASASQPPEDTNAFSQPEDPPHQAFDGNPAMDDTGLLDAVGDGKTDNDWGLTG